jgi:LmbE family N-acetylglucosaminyl deacetylase
MNLFDPDPALVWLFCLTHPDDEVSISAWIKRRVEAGNPVFMSWTHSNPIREAEARAAAHLMGVHQKNLYFHAATDGNVCMEIGRLMAPFTKMIDEVQPDRICCGAFEQGHLDHDATNFILNQIAQCPILEIPFYHTYITRLQVLNRFSDPRNEEILILDRNEQQFKRLIAKQYPSQNIWQVLLWYEISQSARLKRMVLARTERLRLQGKQNYLKPNHPPRISRKVVRSNSWRIWRRAMRTYRAMEPSSHE